MEQKTGAGDGRANMDEPEKAGLDLFGEPIAAIRERRGRPSFKKDKENQRLVALLVADGWSQAKIADYIGCDEKTLRKNFSRELHAGQQMVKAELLAVLYVKARSGNVGAAQKLLDRLEPAVPAPSRPKSEPKPGKKEVLNREASAPTSGWGDILNGNKLQ